MGVTSGPDSIEGVKRLASELCHSREHVNNIVPLLKSMQTTRSDAVFAQSSASINAFFLSLLRSGELQVRDGKRVLRDGLGFRERRKGEMDSLKLEAAAAAAVEGSEPIMKTPADVFSSWLLSRWKDYVGALLAVLRSSGTSDSSQRIALQLSLELAREEWPGFMDCDLLEKVLEVVLLRDDLPDSLLARLSELLSSHVDLRYFSYSCIERLCEKRERKDSPAQVSADAASKQPLQLSGGAKEKGVLGPQHGEESSKQGQGQGQQFKDDRLSMFITNAFSLLSSLPSPPPKKGPSTSNSGGKGSLLKSNEEDEEGSCSIGSLWILGKKGAEPHKGQRDGNKQEESSAKGTKDLRGFKKRKRQDPSPSASSSSPLPSLERKAFSSCWLTYFRLPLSIPLYKKALLRIHTHLIPSMTQPLLLSDLLSTTYSRGGLLSVLSLSSLFLLMTQHGLEYPNFYPQLYALLTPSLLLAKHRARFFELLDSCLSSPLLPSYIAAAFAKRLSRLSLSSPPSGCIVIIALLHNLLRRHPAISGLIHHQTAAVPPPVALKADPAAPGAARDAPAALPPPPPLAAAAAAAAPSGLPSALKGEDPFLEDEPDLSKCRALESSLWELEALKKHYCPAVARFVTSLEADLSQRNSTVDVLLSDFSSASYSSILAEELGRRVKQVPLAFYATTPVSLFGETGNGDGVGKRCEARAYEKQAEILPSADFGGWTFGSL